LQLVAYGAQDIYLTGSPQITFFKVVYRRHTNFAMECISQTFNGSTDWGRKLTCTISRNGDLIHRMYLVVRLPSVTVAAGKAFRWLDWLGHILVSTVDIEIGGQRIDKHYGDWLHIWNELCQTAGHQLGYANMVGNVPKLTNITAVPRAATNKTLVVPETVLYIPLQFWFNRNPGLALPLIALQYHEVKINVDLCSVEKAYWSGAQASNNAKFATDLSAVKPGALLDASLYVDYIYLDTDERRRFAQVSHEYLIEQLQFTGEESTSSTKNSFKLNFNHPTKELIWVAQRADYMSDALPGGKQQFNYSDEVDVNTFNTMASHFGITDPQGFMSDPLLPNGPAGTNLYEHSVSLYGGDTPLPGVNGLANPTNWAALLTAISSSTQSATPEDTNLIETPAFGGMPGIAAGGANRVFVPVSFENGDNPIKTAKLQLNGHDRMDDREGRYFNLVQPYQHHENVPSVGINVYSFALKPEEHQPSGTCNFSRIDNATLSVALTDKTVKNPVTNITRSASVRIYSINYNVLRIMSGMGGLAYSN